MSKSETPDPLHFWLTDPAGSHYTDIRAWKHTPIETFVAGGEATGHTGVNYLHVGSGRFLKSGKTLGEFGIRENDVVAYFPDEIDLDQAVGLALTGKIPSNKTPASPEKNSQARPAPAHIAAGKSIIIVGLVAGGIAGFTCVLGGIFAIYRNAALGNSEVEIFGSKLTTVHVGVAFVFIGMVILGAVINKAFKTVVQLGQISN